MQAHLLKDGSEVGTGLAAFSVTRGPAEGSEGRRHPAPSPKGSLKAGRLKGLEEPHLPQTGTGTVLAKLPEAPAHRGSGTHAQGGGLSNQPLRVASSFLFPPFNLVFSSQRCSSAQSRFLLF